MAQSQMEYTGPIQELQGKTALVRTASERDLKNYLGWPSRGQIWMAQFDDTELTLNNHHLGFGWHPFLKTHFTPITGKPVF